MDAEIVIVGAGLAGLRCGIEILHKRPNATVVILEKYKYMGGRVVTYRKTLQDLKGKCTHLQWENGAGRIHTSHTKVLDLVKRYKLHTFPLSPDQSYVQEGEIQENKFEQLLELFLPSIQRFTPEILAKYTLRQLFEILLKGKVDEFLLQFPYRAEVDTLRADMAIQSFQREMGTYSGYVVVQEGLSELVNGMVEEFVKLGGQIFLQQTVTDIQKDKDLYIVRTKTPNGDVVWEAKTVICALHSEALKQIPCFKEWSALQQLKMEPLLRVYAVFPSEKGKSWFTGIPRSVSPGLIRYFIPINPACGIVMLSYTDGKDARYLEKLLQEKGEEALEDTLMKAVREMFPSHEIPEPLFFKAHAWYEGCTYWLPGSYNPETVSKEALQPFPKTMPDLHCCGESFSLRQAWMEGALEHADELLKTFF
jgi:monoamine oxidase